MKKKEKSVVKELKDSLVKSGKARVKQGMKVPPVMKKVMKERKRG